VVLAVDSADPVDARDRTDPIRRMALDAWLGTLSQTPRVDITPGLQEIDWTGHASLGRGRAAPQRTLDLLNVALDVRLDAMARDVPAVHTRPSSDHVTDTVIGLGITAIHLADDLLVVDVLQRLSDQVVTLREQLHASQTITSASLAHAHQQHARAQSAREARRG